MWERERPFTLEATPLGGGVEEWKKYRQMGAQLLIGAGDFALRDVLEGAKNSMDEALGD